MKNFLNYKNLFILTILTTCLHLWPFSSEAQEPFTSSRCNVFTFDATQSYDPDDQNLSFLWDFGDGSSSNSALAEHTFGQSGDYNVTLTITDNSGFENSSSEKNYLIRANIPPQANFTAPQNVCSNDSFQLDANSSFDDTSSQLAYSWDFGDGSTLSGKKKATHSFDQGGDYPITLTVDDNSGTVCSEDKLKKIVHVNEPPVADAGSNEILKCVAEDSDLLLSFDASRSKDVNNDFLSYVWDLGDGTIKEGARVNHRYDQIGTYDVKLIVDDNTDYGCSTGVDFTTVRLNRAPVAEAGEDLVICAKEEAFFDGSRSFLNKKGTGTYLWNFGDGTSDIGMKVSHIYHTPGEYQADLTVENQLNDECPPSIDSRKVIVNTPPQVSLKVDDTFCRGDIVEFDASSATDPDNNTLEYYWSLGDGTILRAGPKVTHQYTKGGMYQVSVIVDDGQGTLCSTATDSKEILVNSAPVADIGPNLSCCLDKETVFDASRSSDLDGNTLSYKWDFGDGSTSEEKEAVHTYRRGGDFQVKLTVDDNKNTRCSQDSASFVAQVNTKPVPVIDIR